MNTGCKIRTIFRSSPEVGTILFFALYKSTSCRGVRLGIFAAFFFIRCHSFATNRHVRRGMNVKFLHPFSRGSIYRTDRSTYVRKRQRRGRERAQNTKKKLPRRWDANGREGHLTVALSTVRGPGLRSAVCIFIHNANVQVHT